MTLWKRLTGPLARGLHTLSPTCRDASRLQSEMLDRQLTFAQRLGLRLHLILCKWCRRYGRQIRFLREASRDQTDRLQQAAPGNLSPEALKRLKDSLQTKSD